MTKDAFKALLIDAQHLAMDIGVRPAARAMGLSEARVMKWSSRYKWGIAALHPPCFAQPTMSAAVSNGIEAKQRILAMHRSRTQLGMAQSATKVFEHLAEMPSDALVRPATAIAGQQWSKVADITHGYVAERTGVPVTNIAVVAMPSDEDRTQREAMHARLDEIARSLSAQTG